MSAVLHFSTKILLHSPPNFKISRDLYMVIDPSKTLQFHIFQVNAVQRVQISKTFERQDSCSRVIGKKALSDVNNILHIPLVD